MNPVLVACLLSTAPHIQAHLNHARHVPELLVYGVMAQESYCQPDAVSSAGARGLMQVVPSWLRAYNGRLAAHCGTDLHDPKVSVCFGVHILNLYARQCRENWRCALARYSGGHPEYFTQVRARLRVLHEPLSLAVRRSGARVGEGTARCPQLDLTAHP